MDNDEVGGEDVFDALDDGPDADVGLRGCAVLERNGECARVEIERGEGVGKGRVGRGRKEAFRRMVDA